MMDRLRRKFQDEDKPEGEYCRGIVRTRIVQCMKCDGEEYMKNRCAWYKSINEVRK